MSIAETVRYFEYLISRNGPTPSDYDDIRHCLDICHKSQFVIQDGLSHRVNRGGLLEGFCEKHKRVLRTYSSMIGFSYLKPHGYAGEFEIIERVYSKLTSHHPDIQAWDGLFHNNQAARAERTRPGVLKSLIAAEKPRSLLIVGAGPALDVVGALDAEHSIERLSFVDNDQNAISRAKVNIFAAGIDRSICGFHNRNALRFRMEEKYDLIWMSGFFDYLNEKVAIFLLRSIRAMLNEGGLVAVGNFSHENQSRLYMEIFGEWFLIHRGPEQLTKIAEACQFDRDQTDVIVDETGLNLFLLAWNG